MKDLTTGDSKLRTSISRRRRRHSAHAYFFLRILRTPLLQKWSGHYELPGALPNSIQENYQVGNPSAVLSSVVSLKTLQLDRALHTSFSIARIFLRGL